MNERAAKIQSWLNGETSQLELWKNHESDMWKKAYFRFARRSTNNKPDISFLKLEKQLEPEWQSFDYQLSQINPNGLIEKIELDHPVPEFDINDYYVPDPSKKILTLVIKLKNIPVGSAKDTIRISLNINPSDFVKTKEEIQKTLDLYQQEYVAVDNPYFVELTKKIEAIEKYLKPTSDIENSKKPIPSDIKKVIQSIINDDYYNYKRKNYHENPNYLPNKIAKIRLELLKIPPHLVKLKTES